MTPGDTIIVTGGDAVYFPMIDELRRSLVDATQGDPPAFGVIDAGLTGDQSEALRSAGAIVEQCTVLPERAQTAAAKRPALAANLGKLWLNRMFPSFETIIWLDGDTWVQDFAAVRLLHGAAQTKALGIVPGSGRYWKCQLDVRWLLGGIGGLCQMRSFLYKNGRHAGLSAATLRDFGSRALLNAGAFALRADAPHWQSMQNWQSRILNGGGRPFTSDQVAIALAVYQDEWPVELLADTCNYIRPFRVDIDGVSLVEYYYPYPRIGIVHLAGQKSVRFDPHATAEIVDLEGRPVSVSLRYGHFQRDVAALRNG
jgi:hypothetical protein